MTAANRRLHGDAPGDEASRQEATAQLRREHPGWVIIWSARKGEYQARPLFRAPPETVAAAPAPEALTSQVGNPATHRQARPQPA
jgi:hypothetical protein